MIKLFTHDDLDGVGCVILAKFAFGDNVSYQACSHKEINQAVETHFNQNTNDEVHITDISLVGPIVQKIDDSGRNYQLLDHHPTALDMNKYRWCTVQINGTHGFKTSGTEMYYKYLLNRGCLTRTHMLDKFVEIVRNYDTWRWNELGDEGLVSKRVNDVFEIYDEVYGIDSFISWAIFCINHESFPHFHDCEKIMLEMRQKEIDAYVEEKNAQLLTVNFMGKNAGIVFADKFFSEMGNRICKIRPEIDFIMMLDLGNKAISYRTIKDDINVGEIAKTMGGGGHAKAAGSGLADVYCRAALAAIFGSRME